MPAKPLISVDEDGDIIGVHFNNRSLDWLDAPTDLMEPWFAAYRKLRRHPAPAGGRARSSAWRRAIAW